MLMLKFKNINNTTIQKMVAGIKKDYARKDKNGKYYYYNIESAFDIESTSAVVDDKKVSFMYAWVFEIGYDNEPIVGRTWNEAIKLFKMVSNELNLDDFDNLVCYIHNFSFEFQFMKDLFRWLNVFAVDERKPVKALSEFGIEFRDSYILSGMNLDRTGKNLTSHSVRKQVGSLDYSKIRTSKTPLTDKEWLYVVDDAKVLCAYINEQIGQYGSIVKVPLTNTGRVRNLVRNNCYFTSRNHKKSSASKYIKYSKLMESLKIKDKTEYEMLQRAFQGGFTHASSNHVGKTLKDVGSYDFTSSYPAVMLTEKYPLSSAVELKPKSMNEFNDLAKEYLLVFEVKFKNIISSFDYENYLSDSKCYNASNKIVNNGRLVKADQLTTTTTSIDFDIIKRTYEWEKMGISKVIGYRKGYLPKPIIESIIKLYKDKTELKNVKGSEVEYLNSKGMLNSTYGMCVTNIIQDEHVFNNEDGWVNEPADVDDQIEKYNNNRKRFLYYPWGVFVTAYARRNLWSGILAIGKDYVYSDTDSIKCLNINNHIDYINAYNNQVTKKVEKMCDHYGLDKKLLSPKTIEGKVKPIGVWDNEGVYDIFKTLGAKRYLVKQNGDYKLTVAGLSKKNGINYIKNICNNDDNKIFNFFTNEMYIPESKTGKNTHTYIDEPNEFDITDYQGNKDHVYTKSGVHLGSCDFTMSLSGSYVDFIKHLRNGELYKGVEFKL